MCCVTERRRSGVTGYVAFLSVLHASLSWGWRRDRHTPRTGGQSMHLQLLNCNRWIQNTKIIDNNKNNNVLTLLRWVIYLVLCFFCQASDPGSGERGCWAERRAASSALSGKSAESRERSDHCWHLSSRNLPRQLHWGPESRSGSSSNL